MCTHFAFTHPGGMAHGSIGRTFVYGYHGNCRSAATAWVEVITECTKWIHWKKNNVGMHKQEDV